MSDSVKDVENLPYRPCAGIMLLNADGRVFVGQRIDTTGEAWQMPQGGIDKGENPEAAALRELEEEIGVKSRHVEIIAESQDWFYYDLPDELMGKMWGGKYRGQRQKWFVMRLNASDDAVNIETKHPEFNEWRWIDPVQLPDVIVPFKKHLYQQLLEEFASFLR